MVLYDRKYVSVVDKTDFKNAINKEMSFFEDAPDIGLNQIVWDSVKQQARIKKDAANAGRLEVDLGNLKEGDMVRVSLGAKNISGNQVRIHLLQFTSPTSYSSSDFWDVQGTDFQNVETTFVVKKNLFHALYIGVGGVNQVTDFILRDVKVEVLSKVAFDKNYRVAAIRMVSGSFVQHSDYANDPFSIKNESNQIIVTFKKPLPKKAVAFAQDGYYIVGNKYIVKTAYATEDSVTIQIFLTSNPTSPVAINSIENYMQINVMMFC